MDKKPGCMKQPGNLLSIGAVRLNVSLMTEGLRSGIGTRNQTQRRRTTNLPMEELLTGILHNRLGRVLAKTAGIKGKQFAHEISNTELREVIVCVKGLEIDLTEPLGMDSAQVTAGGVLTDGFEPDSMESKLVPGLYACGEVLDIDGDCGGYNLQWAWSSGRMAGIHAGKDK